MCSSPMMHIASEHYSFCRPSSLILPNTPTPSSSITLKAMAIASDVSQDTICSTSSTSPPPHNGAATNIIAEPPDPPPEHLPGSSSTCPATLASSTPHNPSSSFSSSFSPRLPQPVPSSSDVPAPVPAPVAGLLSWCMACAGGVSGEILVWDLRVGSLKQR